MKKIPTVFERDWLGNKSRVTAEVHPGCEWVIRGEGVATRKIDGTCCMIRDGKLYKRRELKDGDAPPADFEIVGRDEETGKTVGWVAVGEGPEDRWHREALSVGTGWPDGTYELVGPKVQGNPEKMAAHWLIRHGEGEAGPLEDVPRDYEGLKAWFAGRDIEGIVFHHADGRAAKIKMKDFGMKRMKRKSPAGRE